MVEVSALRSWTYLNAALIGRPIAIGRRPPPKKFSALLCHKEKFYTKAVVVHIMTAFYTTGMGVNPLVNCHGHHYIKRNFKPTS